MTEQMRRAQSLLKSFLVGTAILIRNEVWADLKYRLCEARLAHGALRTAGVGVTTEGGEKIGVIRGEDHRSWEDRNRRR